MIGATLDNYRILEKLGAGGQGEVYKAVDTKLGRSVVVKVLPPDLTVKEANLKRFEREARLASSLDHPNICTIFDLGEEGNVHYIAMQYVEGRNVRQLVNGRPLELKSALSIAVQVTDALAAAHACGIIHRDIKAQNYPAMLIKVSLNDSQVPYWEGAKFAAKLRAMKTDSNVLLLKTNMGAGHGGSSGRYDYLKEVAFDYAFMLNQFGITS